jgi:hypothetical protein
MVRAVKKDSIVRDLQGSELVIEFSSQQQVSAKKPQAGSNSLAEVETTFRNNEIEVSFEFDAKLKKYIQNWPEEDPSTATTSAKGGKGGKEKESATATAVSSSSSSSSSSSTGKCMVTVDHTQTLGELKRKMLMQLCLEHLNCLDPSPSNPQHIPQHNSTGNKGKSQGGRQGGSQDDGQGGGQGDRQGDKQGGDMDAMGGSILELCVAELLGQVRMKLNPDLAGKD